MEAPKDETELRLEKALFGDELGFLNSLQASRATDSEALRSYEPDGVSEPEAVEDLEAVNDDEVIPFRSPSTLILMDGSYSSLTQVQLRLPLP